MPTGPAARITDNVVHPLPPVLTPGPGALTVLIGFLPAWRAVPTGAGAALQAANQAATTTIKAAEAATAAAAGTPGAPAAYAAEQATKGALLASMSAMVNAIPGDTHACVTPLPVPPHGPGKVIDGSATVLTENLPQSRMGDTIIEAVGPPNKIAKGEMTVIVGG
ncbi:MAG: PAAR domain-containing protein [Pyrinomonadaceae bacterium]|nr:PAAR domain-containing protein [Blastocatellia bacterium]MCW5955519.1 PAAR domain-containing protein [Pyrinomonadaceae bacterium]